MGQETLPGAVFLPMVVRRIGRMLGLPAFEVVDAGIESEGNRKG